MRRRTARKTRYRADLQLYTATSSYFGPFGEPFNTRQPRRTAAYGKPFQNIDHRCQTPL